MKERDEDFKNKLNAEQEKIIEIKQELVKIQQQRDELYDVKQSFESTLDGKDKAMNQVWLELQRSQEEVQCRKAMIDELSKSLLDHEAESMQMATKLS